MSSGPYTCDKSKINRMENRIAGKGCKNLNIREFINNMLDFDPEDRAKIRLYTENFGIDMVSIQIKKPAKDVPNRYDVDVIYGMGIKEGDKKWLFIETLSSFSIDLEREILSMSDAPISGLMMLACEAAGSTRAFMQSLTVGEPFSGFLLGLGWGMFPMEAKRSVQKFLSNRSR